VLGNLDKRFCILKPHDTSKIIGPLLQDEGEFVARDFQNDCEDVLGGHAVGAFNSSYCIVKTPDPVIGPIMADGLKTLKKDCVGKFGSLLVFGGHVCVLDPMSKPLKMLTMTARKPRKRRDQSGCGHLNSIMTLMSVLLLSNLLR